MSDTPTPTRRGTPLRRDALVDRKKLTRTRRTTPAGVIGHAILNLITSIETQTVPDPRVTPAWDTLMVTATDDPDRGAVRLSATVDLDEVPAPRVLPGGNA